VQLLQAVANYPNTAVDKAATATDTFSWHL